MSVTREFLFAYAFGPPIFKPDQLPPKSATFKIMARSLLSGRSILPLSVDGIGKPMSNEFRQFQLSTRVFSDLALQILWL